MIVNLTIKEVADAIALGKARQGAKKELWANNDAGFHKGVKGREFPHIVGLLGEIAFGKLIGKEINRELYALGDCGWDFNGIDIKTTLYQGKDLGLFIKEKDLQKKCDYYILARTSTDYRKVTFLGYTSKEYFLKYKRPGMFEKTWFLDAHKLNPISELIEHYAKGTPEKS